MMRPDGGEAQRLTDTREGVRDYALTEDGRWLVYRTGKDDEEQLFRLPASGTETAAAEQITRHPTGIGSWRVAPNGRRIYFVSPDGVDDDKARREKKFTVIIRNPERPSASLWALDLDPVSTKKLSDGGAYAADAPIISPDGQWVAFRGQSLNRYQRGITQEGLYADLYLLQTANGEVERLTNNFEVPESALRFSPDSRWIAFASPRRHDALHDVERAHLPARRQRARRPVPQDGNVVRR